MHFLRVIRVVASPIAGLMLVAVTASPARPQDAAAFSVRVVDSATARAIVGASVEIQLRASSAASTWSVVATRFTDSLGLARFTVASRGQYRVTVRRIGFTPGGALIPLLSIAAHAAVPPSHDLVIRLARRPGQLDVVQVRADPACPIDMGRAADAFPQWPAVIDAFTIASAFAHDSATSFEVRSSEQARTRTDSLVEQAAVTVHSTATPLIVGQSAGWLDAHGYATATGSTWAFEVPSPDVLRSDEFERSHCFARANAMVDSTKLSLRFSPTKDRTMADVAGEIVIDRATLAPIVVSLRYVRTPLPLGQERARATLEFGRTANDIPFLRAWGLSLPLIARDNLHDRNSLSPVLLGTIVTGQSVRLIDRVGDSANGDVAISTDCSAIALSECLERGNDNWSKRLTSVSNRYQAIGYYRQTCERGPNAMMRGLIAGVRGRPPITTVDRLLREVQDAGVDTARLRRRGEIIDLLWAGGRDRFDETRRAEYAELIQMDGCGRLGLALAHDDATRIDGVPRRDLSLAALAASCAAGEGISCETIEHRLPAVDDMSSRMSAARRALRRRACALEFRRACRAMPSEGGAIEQPSEAERWLTGRVAPAPARLIVLRSTLTRELAHDETAEVDTVGGGVLATFYPDHSDARRADPLDPVGEEGLDAVARLLRADADLRALLVFHDDAPRREGPLARDIRRLRMQAEERAATRWLLQHAVDGFHFDSRVLLNEEPAASNSTLLGRQMNRRLEIALSWR